MFFLFGFHVDVLLAKCSTNFAQEPLTFAQPFDAGGGRLEEEITWLRLHHWSLGASNIVQHFGFTP